MLRAIRVYAGRDGWMVDIDTAHGRTTEPLGYDMAGTESEIEDAVAGIAAREGVTIRADEVGVDPDKRSGGSIDFETRFDFIIEAIEAEDVEAPEQVADMCIAAFREYRDWRKVLADAVALDAASNKGTRAP